MRLSAKLAPTASEPGENDETDVIAREHQRPDVDGSGHAERLIKRVGAGSKDQTDHVFEDEEGGVGDEHDDDFVLAVDQAQEAALDNQAKHEPDRHGDEHHQQKSAGRRQAAVEVDADRDRGAVGAERIERAVSDVEDFHDAEDQRETDGDEEQIGRVDEAVSQDGKGGQHVEPCSVEAASQSHLAPFMPPSSQGTESTSAGGFTQAAG